MLEVYQFARDAAVAEQWLIAQEPYLLNEDLGETLDQVEQLIKKHETFEKSIHAQEERFNALRKLTTLEIKQRRTTNNEQLPVEEQQQQQATPVDRTKLENSRMQLYLEEFKTIEERDRDLESQRQQEKLVKEAEENVKREQEAREQEAARQRATEVIDVTKVLASVGAQQSKLSSSSPKQRDSGKLKKKIFFLFFVNIGYR
jgi:spectrin beta